MARKTVVVSDMSGDQIPEGKGAKVRITFDDARSHHRRRVNDARSPQEQGLGLGVVGRHDGQLAAL